MERVLERLEVARLPGEMGPILRCTGPLTRATAEDLGQELERMASLGHPALVLDLSRSYLGELEAGDVLHRKLVHLWAEGLQMALVLGPPERAYPFVLLEIDRLFPAYETVEEATRALRGDQAPAPAPVSWSRAREETVQRWRAIYETIHRQDPAEVMREVTGMFPLCERAQEIAAVRGEPGCVRCEQCPLFYRLGGDEAAVGCRKVVEPILEALEKGDRCTASALVDGILDELEAMPAPDNGVAPARWVPLPPV